VFAAPFPASPVSQPSPPASLDLQHRVWVWNLFPGLICQTASLSPSKAFQRAIAALTPAGTFFPVVPRLNYGVFLNYLFLYIQHFMILSILVFKTKRYLITANATTSHVNCPASSEVSKSPKLSLVWKISGLL